MKAIKKLFKILIFSFVLLFLSAMYRIFQDRLNDDSLLGWIFHKRVADADHPPDPSGDGDSGGGGDS